MNAKTVLLSLVRAALNEGDLGAAASRVDPDGWRAVDWAAVHRLALSQSLEGISWCGIEAAELCAAVPAAERTAWETQANNTLRRRVLFEAERERVFGAMHEAGLATLELKGCRIASYYPDPRMRAMADIDVLYGFVEQDPVSGDYRPTARGLADVEHQPAEKTPRGRVRRTAPDTADHRAAPRNCADLKRATEALVQVMTDLGYTVKSRDVGTHDVFYRHPLYNLEAHRALFSSKLPFAGAFENPWERAIPAAQVPCNALGMPLSFRYIAEDEYAYLICHAFKHYETSGCGMRFLVDMEALRRAYGDEIDWQLVDLRMRQLGLAAWEADMRALSREAFGPEGAGIFSAEQDAVLDFLLESGTYGTMVRRVSRLIEDACTTRRGPLVRLRGTCSYVTHRVLLDEQTLRETFPFYYDHRWARAALPFIRMTRGLASGNVQNEVRVLWSLR